MAILSEVERDELAAIDTDWSAAMWILRCGLLARDGRVWRHVSKQGIDFPAIEREGTFSHGELLLVQVAGSLFNSSLSVDLRDVCILLSDTWFETVLTAMQIRSGTMVVENAKSA